MTVITNRLRQMAQDLTDLADAFEKIEGERDFYKRQAVKWAEAVDRQRLDTYADRVQHEQLLGKAEVGA